MLKVLYFASIREQLGFGEETLPLPNDATVNGVIDVLRARSDVYAEALAAGKRWRVAVNQDMAALDAIIQAGDEIAIFPPVTGG
jgi:sulfur-carrier protein